MFSRTNIIQSNFFFDGSLDGIEFCLISIKSFFYFVDGFRDESGEFYHFTEFEPGESVREGVCNELESVDFRQRT